MKKENRGKLKIIPLGGLEQIGMNITAFEYEDSIIVVDCGLAFPEDDSRTGKSTGDAQGKAQRKRLESDQTETFYFADPGRT